MSITIKPVVNDVSTIPVSWRLARGIVQTLITAIDNRLALIAAELNSISSGTTVVATGTVVDFAGSSGSVPSGYLICDGTVYNIADYPDLGGLLGSSYGGNGTTTFGVPDIRGRVVAGQDDMGGTGANRVTDAAADSLGGVLGSEEHTLVTTELAAHLHDEKGAVAGGSTLVGWAQGSIGSQQQGPASDLDTALTGGGNAHANIQPTIFLNKMIKT